MDKKDKIILQQLDVIRSMTENNMKRMNSDFWGTPFENVTGDAPKSPAAPAKDAERKNTPPTATAKPGDEKPAEELLGLDFKEFHIAGHNIGIGQVTCLDSQKVLRRLPDFDIETPGAV